LYCQRRNSRGSATQLLSALKFSLKYSITAFGGKNMYYWKLNKNILQTLITSLHQNKKVIKYEAKWREEYQIFFS
jgi:predicted alpha/beta-fold hydrolase